MENRILRQYNAFEIVMFVHEMHSHGYGKLRLFSGMSPNGCAWRWFIYPKILMKSDNLFERHDDHVPFDCPFGVTGDSEAIIKCHDSIDEAIRANQSFFDLAKGQDDEYVTWFSSIVEQAKRGAYPIAFADCYLANTWMFTNGQDPLPFPPFTPDDIDDFSDEQLLAGVPFLFNQSSAAELNEVLNFQGTKPDNQTICSVIRQALKENKGLLSHIDTYFTPNEIDLFPWSD